MFATFYCPGVRGTIRVSLISFEFNQFKLKVSHEFRFSVHNYEFGENLRGMGPNESFGYENYESFGYENLDS